MANPKTKGRMINKGISDSKRFASLSPPAGVLFCLLIPHLNGYGKANGAPEYIKGEVCPRISYLSIKNIYTYLKEINDKTNVKWFKLDGRYWIHSINFLNKHQKLDKSRLGQDLLPTYSALSPTLVVPEVEVEVEVEVEGEGKSDVSRELTKPNLLTETEWLESLKINPAYKGLDIEKELYKCLAYFQAQNISVSRKRFLNWINRADKSITRKRGILDD